MLICRLQELQTPGGRTLGIFLGGCAAGTLEPLAYTRGSADFSELLAWLLRM